MDLTPLINDGTLTPLLNRFNSPTSISLNSKTVEKGGLFIAIPGSRHDGAAFVGEALRRGAGVVVASQGVGVKIASNFKEQYPDVSFFETREIRKAASFLASCFYPLQPDNIVAVTGTNGKTSVVSFIRQIWAHLGIPAASLGTLGLIIEDKPLPAPTGTEGLNTPDPIRLHQILQALKQDQVDYLAFEASSHGLHQHRLESVCITAGVFTNFSNDHLDYHHTLEAYFAAKARLFEEIVGDKAYAILNTDMAEYERLVSLCQKRQLPMLTFGKEGKTVQLISVVPKADNQDVLLRIKGRTYNFTLPLVGQFQVYNVMAALAAVIACGGKAAQAIEACLTLKGVPGRLEQAVPGIYVDYAHTPDGLSLALKTLRPHTEGKLCVVFGCGGNRDSFKRPIMGEIAAALADKVIITDDNPRDEDPALIRKQILEKCSRACEIPSRREAIRTAIAEMQEGDIVLIAGKGHETYQLIRDQALPFNDVEEVQKSMRDS